MRPVLLLLSICSTSVATIQLDERRASTLDTSILLDLPPCLLQCVTELLPQFNCSSAECFCDAKGLLKDRMTACTTSACTNLDDELKGVRLQAEICGWKPHTDAPPTEDTAYGLFTVVAIFVLARLLYRLPQLGGVGYGWDDYTLILCFPAAVGMTVTAHYAAEYGSGKDLWLLSAEELQHFFIVSRAVTLFDLLPLTHCSGYTPASPSIRSLLASPRSPWCSYTYGSGRRRLWKRGRDFD